MDYGEVLTGKREVNAMLDLVKQETERIESRFLEPACGTGNFLSPVLERKLTVVEKRYGRSQLDYERYAILAVSSIYGIDILEDNVEQCRRRLFGVFDWNYTRLFKKKARNGCRETVQFILKRNIIWGDALTLKTADPDSQPIIFSEWSLVGGSKFKRRDFAFYELTSANENSEPSLFTGCSSAVVSDLGDRGFIPTPEKEYPPVHFLEIAHAQRQ